MTNDQELAFTPAWKLRDMMSSKQVSPLELTELYLRRIEALDHNLNAYLTVTADEALRDARQAETSIQSGQPLGPLHGIPISIKDLNLTKGSAHNQGFFVVQRLCTADRRAGGQTHQRSGSHCSWQDQYS